MWRDLDPEEEVTIKVKKKSEKHRLGDLELSKPPILLKDGDHIGVLVDGSAADDMQTEADKDAAEAFRVQKEQEKAEKAKKAAAKRVFNDNNVGIHINLEDEEERLMKLAMEESLKDT